MRVLVLFFGSGLASLLLETVYRRQLSLLLGSAVTATSITLATFLGGLALGAAVYGRRADRTASPLALYGRLELGVAATGGAALCALTFGREALLLPARALGGGAPSAAVAAAVAALVVMPSTVLMGGTLPALARHVARRRDEVLGSVATLYGVNTMGAAAGTALAGFVLFERIGVLATGAAGVVLAGAIGGLALATGRSGGPAPAAEEEGSPSPFAAVALASAALGGAAALGYEVVWTRLLVLPLRSFGYSFSLMLALFLTGLFLGALALGALGSRVRRPLPALAGVQIAAGAYVAASVLWLPSLLTAEREGGGLAGFVLAGALRAAPLVLPPTILSGIAFPLAVSVFSGRPALAGRSAARVYAANAAGSIAGALLAGLVLIPAIGAPRSLVLLAALSAAAGAIAGWRAWPGGAARAALVAVPLACLIPLAVSEKPYREAFGRTRAGDQGAELYFHEGATDTVAVVHRRYGFRDPDAKSVVVNGIAMTATVKPVWRYMAAEGHLPALTAPAPTRALVICVGTGITLEALASHGTVTAIDAVDLSEGVLGALPVFARENREAFRDPKVRLHHADGRHHLEMTGARYEVISLEPPPPIVAGSVHLYTLDFYRLCARRLAEGGIVAQWLPLHAQSLDSARATARTFLEAFPHAQLWLPSIRDAVLLGSARPIRIDPSRLRDAYASPRTRESLEAAYLETPEALLATYLLDRDGIARWAEGADVVTDDRPTIEFFRRYGRNMGDAEIATLLASPPAPFDAGPVVEAERAAHLLYLRAEAADDPHLSRQAARAARGTRFGRYRLGCDTPQLAFLREETGAGTAWARQRDACAGLGLGD